MGVDEDAEEEDESVDGEDDDEDEGGAEDADRVPLLYHLKACPHAFLYGMLVMCEDREALGKKLFALYPMRTRFVPMHAKFEYRILQPLLRARYAPDLKRLRAASAAMQKRMPAKELESQVCTVVVREKLAELQASTCTRRRTAIEKEIERYGKRLQAADDAIAHAHEELDRARAAVAPYEFAQGGLDAFFATFLDLRRGGVHRRALFANSFTTDGVTIRLHMHPRQPVASHAGAMPKRGLFSMQALASRVKLEEVHVIGVDPGKHSLVMCKDMESSKLVQYTQKQRRHQSGSRQFARRLQSEKADGPVGAAESTMTGHSSRSCNLQTFVAYCAARREAEGVLRPYYELLKHRERRRQTCIRTQMSEERLYRRLEALRTDERPLVLAHGAAGKTLGRPEMPCNRGNPSCIGVGLMRKLATRFLVGITPEHYTSKRCCKCGGEVKPCRATEKRRRREMAEEKRKDATMRGIRGLRRCTQRGCMAFHQRDVCGATNIGYNGCAILRGGAPLYTLDEDDNELLAAEAGEA